MVRQLGWASLWMALVACQAVSETGLPAPAEPAEDTHDSGRSFVDTDEDGLCDDKELELGTDPLAVDSDGDGMPDLVEVVMVYDAGDPLDPDPSRIAYLDSAEGSETTFQVAVSVRGSGEAYSGAYQPRPPIFDLPQTAEDFYRGALALSADPIDNVREQSSSAARFGSVLGPARLRFQLSFEQGLPESELRDCVVPHPFGFTVKADDGTLLSSQEYLLVVGPADDVRHGEAFCLPRTCF